MPAVIAESLLVSSAPLAYSAVSMKRECARECRGKQGAQARADMALARLICAVLGERLGLNLDAHAAAVAETIARALRRPARVRDEVDLDRLEGRPRRHSSTPSRPTGLEVECPPLYPGAWHTSSLGALQAESTST